MRNSLRVLLVVVLLYALVAVVLPNIGPPTSGRRRSPCKNNLKNIGLALHNYHAKYGSLPPAYVADETGQPVHSWRVLILPFLDNQELFDRYDFSVPWNHPKNRYVLEHMPLNYCCDDDPDREGIVTSYFACFGPNCAFSGAETVRFSDFRDGQTNSILVGEAMGLHVPWTKPEDIDIAAISRFGELGGITSVHGAHPVSAPLGIGTHFLLGDGAVRFITYDIEPEVLRNLSTINDGNPIPSDF